MRTLFDRLAKQILSPLLGRFGTVLTEAEIVSDASRMDLAFIPGGRRERPPDHKCPRFLAGVVEEPLAVECFSDAVETQEVMRCIGKLAAWNKQLQGSAPGGSEGGRPQGNKQSVPRLWILSAGVPESALRVFDCRPKLDWPEGTYTLLGHGGLIVLSRLPVVPDTLIFRLLAKGEVQRQALRELLALPRNAFERAAMPAMKVFYGELMGRSARTKSEEQFVQNTGDLFEKYEQDLEDKGRREKALEVLTLQLQQRFGSIPASRQSQLAEAGVGALDAWLARIITAESLDAVFEKQAIVDG